MEFQKQFYSKVRKNRYKVLLSILSGIGRSILMLIPTLLMRNIYNSLENNFNVRKVMISSLLTFVIPLLVMILFIIDIRLSKYIFEIIKEIRIGALRYILNLRLRNILALNYGEIFSNLIQSLSQLGDYYYYSLNTLTWYATACVVGIALMLYINWKISLILLLITLLQIFCVLLTKKYIKRIKEEENAIHAEGTDYAMSLLTQNAFIKVSQREYAEMEMADRWIRKSWENTKKKIRNDQIISALTVLITTIRSIYLFIAVHILFLSNSMMKGDFIALNSYILWLTPVFIGFQECLTNTIVSQTNKKRIDTFISNSSEDSDLKNFTPDGKLESIEVNDLSFAYEREYKNVLNNLSIKGEFGERIYIVGASGTGKSTLLNILMDLEKTYTGEVLMNGTDIRNINEKWLHRNVVLVGQDVDILPTTLRENLLYSGVESTDEEMMTGLKSLNLEYLLSMPGGLDWNMKENPRNLSDGEKKRLAILRAVLSKPNALLLDEPTAGLDNINKMNVMQYIIQKIDGMLIVVTHDVIYQTDDRILHLEDSNFVY